MGSHEQMVDCATTYESPRLSKTKRCGDQPSSTTKTSSGYPNLASCRSALDSCPKWSAWSTATSIAETPGNATPSAGSPASVVVRTRGPRASMRSCASASGSCARRTCTEPGGYPQVGERPALLAVDSLAPPAPPSPRAAVPSAPMLIVLGLSPLPGAAASGSLDSITPNPRTPTRNVFAFIRRSGQRTPRTRMYGGRSTTPAGVTHGIPSCGSRGSPDNPA